MKTSGRPIEPTLLYCASNFRLCPGKRRGLYQKVQQEKQVEKARELVAARKETKP